MNRTGPIQVLPDLLVVLAYGVGFVVIGSTLLQHFGFPLDDSWIHQSVGRNFAQYGSLGYLPQQRSSGSTSLLWTCLLAANYRFLPGLSPVTFTLSFNVLCAIATAIILLRLAREDGASTPFAVVIAAAPAFDGNYLWLAFTGMEHLLFVMLSVATIWLWMSPTTTPRAAWVTSITAGVCMGLLGMTRPEGIVLPLLLLGASILFTPLRTRSTSQLATVGAIFIALASIPPVVNLYGSKSLLPVTFKGRQWMLVSDAATWLAAVIRLPEQWCTRIFKSVVVFAGGELDLQGKLLLLAALVPVVVLAGYGVRGLVRQRSWRLLAVCAWGLLHAVLYLAILPSSGHGGRYQPFLLLLLLPLLCAGAADLLRQHKRAAIWVPVAGLVLFGCVSLTLWRAVLASGIDHISHTHARVAAWLQENLPDQTVAVFDIGRIGYARGTSGDPRIIDLGGLTDSGYLAYLYGGKVPEYLALHDVRYLVLPVDPVGASDVAHRLRLQGNPAVKRRRLFQACSTHDAWEPGWFETGNAFQCQEVDSVTFAPESGS